MNFFNNMIFTNTSFVIIFHAPQKYLMIMKYTPGYDIPGKSAAVLALASDFLKKKRLHGK